MRMTSWAVSFVALLATTGTTDRPARLVESDLIVVVDRSDKQLVVKVGERRLATYTVTVGEPNHETPLGTYRLSRVIWNPAWVPPNSKWADTAKAKDPGERGNPMGRVKIHFDSLLYIHGTTQTAELGEEASHGCIRMSNADVMRLARLVMDHGGAKKPAAWHATVRRNPKKSYPVALPEPPELRIVE